MANKSLISDLLLTPSQVRAKEDKERLTRGMAQAQLFNQGNPLGGVGGMFASFGASQAAQTGQNISDAFRRAGTAFGIDMASPEEKQAANVQNILRRPMPVDLEGLKKRRQQLAQANVPAQVLESLDQKILEMTTTAQAKAKTTAQLNSVAQYILSKDPSKTDLANMVKSGAIKPADAITVLNKGIETKVVGKGDTLVNASTGETLFEAPEEPGDVFTIMTPDEVSSTPGLDPNLNYQKNTSTGKISTIGSNEIVPSAGPGWRTTRVKNPDGSISYTQEPVPGGKVAKEIEEAKRKQASGMRSETNRVNRIQGQVKDIRSIIEDDDSWATGKKGRTIELLGTLTGGIAVADTDRIRLTEALGSLRANLGFDKLQDMRNNSPTGGALGNVSNIELIQLERALTSLNPDLGREALDKNLDLVEEAYANVLEEFANAYSDEELAAAGLAEVGAYRTITLDEQGNRVVLADENTDVLSNKLDSVKPSILKGMIDSYKLTGDASGFAATLGVDVDELEEWLKKNG